MMMNASLTSSTHPEYGEVTVPFPIPDEVYDHMMDLLSSLGIGDVLAQDCRVVGLESRYPVLDRLEGTVVNVDELDYLAKRLDSFCAGEDEQFLAMAHKLDLENVKDFINLTFCCQQATVITNFSDLERIGKDHLMTLNGGGMPIDQYRTIDGTKEALRLIQGGGETVTPFGVVYDNGMELEQLYDRWHFPSYLYKPSVLALEAVSDDAEGYFCLPISNRQLQRTIERAGLEYRDIPLDVILDELPEKAADVLALEKLTVNDLPELNRMCWAIEPLNDADIEKLNAVILLAKPTDASSISQLAEHLDQFDFIPGLQTQASGGQLNECGYVSYHGAMPLEELMGEEPAEQPEQEMRMM